MMTILNSFMCIRLFMMARLTDVRSSWYMKLLTGRPCLTMGIICLSIWAYTTFYHVWTVWAAIHLLLVVNTCPYAGVLTKRLHGCSQHGIHSNRLMGYSTRCNPNTSKSCMTKNMTIFIIICTR